MIEIIGSKYCMACHELIDKLKRDNLEYVFYDSLELRYSDRHKELNKIAADDGFTRHPIIFHKSECLGEGLAIYNRILKLEGIIPA